MYRRGARRASIRCWLCGRNNPLSLFAAPFRFLHIGTLWSSYLEKLVMVIRQSIVSVFILVLFMCPLRAVAQPAPNVVTQWAAIVQQSIHNAAAPRSAGSSQVLHTMVHLAVHDAVAAIEGGYSPYRASKSKRSRARRGCEGGGRHGGVPHRARQGCANAGGVPRSGVCELHGRPSRQDRPRPTASASAPPRRRRCSRQRAGDGFSNVVLYQCSEVPPPPGRVHARHRLPRRRHRIRSRLMRRSGRSRPTRSAGAPTSSRAGRAR